VERRVIDDDKKVLQAAKLFWKGEAVVQRNWLAVNCNRSAYHGKYFYASVKLKHK
jgi:hypothetical protein